MIDPYRIFFPLGLLSGFLGTLAWIPFALGLTQSYPGTEHPHLMIGGFVLSFAVGFLMTAIPRFTESFPAKSAEVYLQAVVIAAMILTGVVSLSIPEWRAVSLLLQVVSLGLLVLFCLPRFLARKQKPPPSFLFVGIGLVCGLIGSAFLLLDEQGSLSPELALLGRSLFYRGMMLSLVVGVGGRLIPVLLGQAPSPMEKAGPTGAVNDGQSGAGVWALIAVFYFLSFPVDFFVSDQLGGILRALIVTFVAVRFWGIFRPSRRKGALPLWLRIAGSLLVAGECIAGFFPQSGVHGVHLTFAGGYSLLTLLIATRVILSHGGHDLSLELKSKTIHAMGILMCGAALTRSMAPLVPNSYLPHLAYASVGWTLGGLLWARTFIPLMWRGRRAG